MGWIKDFLLGSEGKIDWDELKKMVQLEAEISKTDRMGIYGGSEWERDPEGRATGRQLQRINPMLQPAANRMGHRANQGNTPYTSPGQFSSLLDSKMANQMTRAGIPPNSPNASPWVPAADRPGRFMENPYLPPPPPGTTPPGDELLPPGGDTVPPGTTPPGGDFTAPAPLPPTGGDFTIPGPLPPTDYKPGDSPEEQKGYGLPPDYYNDEGGVRAKYRPGTPKYLGDDWLAQWKDPNFVLNPNAPGFREAHPDWFNKKGFLKKAYRVGG